MNLVPLAADEVCVLADGLKKAKRMSVIRLKCESRGGLEGAGVAAVAKSAAALGRAVTARKQVVASALSNERVARKLGQAVAAQLKQTRTLMELEVGSNLGAAASEAMAKGVAANESLVRLSFADSNMGDASFAKLIDGLRLNNKIRELDLSWCGLTDASGTAIGSILRAHASRRATMTWESNLRCYPGSAAARDLANRGDGSGDGGTGGLTSLNLSYNNLSTETIKSIAAGLRQDTKLASLRLKGNKISEEAAGMLGQAMKEHPKLASIELEMSTVSNVDLGTLRVVPGSEVSFDHPEMQGETIVKKDVFMDMDVRPDTPRGARLAEAKAAAAAIAAGVTTKKKRRPASAAPPAIGTLTASGMAGWYEGKRGWSPASAAPPPKWKAMGEHATAARVPTSIGDNLEFAAGVGASALGRKERASAAFARPMSAPAGGKKKRTVVKKKASLPPPPLGSTLGAMQKSPGDARRDAVLATRTNAMAPKDEKALVHQLTRALNTLEDRISTMNADELREQVSAAARAAATASKLSTMQGRANKKLTAKVTEDLAALEKIIS